MFDKNGKRLPAVVAVDTVQAGTGDVVLVVTGSSARMNRKCQWVAIL